MGIFGDTYSDTIGRCLTIDDFIKKANIKKIGIPIFIAHGNEISPVEIFARLKAIKRNTILGLQTTFIIISLPIFNKSKLIGVLTEKIAERRSVYEQAISDI